MTDRPSISPEEIARRRKAWEVAKDDNRFEFIPHDPTTDPIVEAWIVDEIDMEEVIARIKAALGLTP